MNLISLAIDAATVGVALGWTIAHLIERLRR